MTELLPMVACFKISEPATDVSDVARVLDVGPTRVNRWLKGGEPEPDVYDKLVKFLRLDGWPALGELVLASKAAQFKSRPTRRV
jgi:hypothetical protein